MKLLINNNNNNNKNLNNFEKCDRLEFPNKVKKEENILLVTNWQTSNHRNVSGLQENVEDSNLR